MEEKRPVLTESRNAITPGYREAISYDSLN